MGKILNFYSHIEHTSQDFTWHFCPFIHLGQIWDAFVVHYLSQGHFHMHIKGETNCLYKLIYLKKKGLIHVFVKGCLIMWLIQVVGQSLDSTNWSLCWACNLHGQLQYISENWEVVDHSHLCLCSSILILSFPIKGSIWVSFLAFQEGSLHISIRGQLHKAESLEPLSTVTFCLLSLWVVHSTFKAEIMKKAFAFIPSVWFLIVTIGLMLQNNTRIENAFGCV